MKRLLLILFLTCLPAAFTGCATPPSARVVQVQTLKAVGHGAEASVALAANLHVAGKLTTKQLDQVATFYDSKFQPAFRLAVAMVPANLDSAASPELAGLAAQLAALVVSFQTK